MSNRHVLPRLAAFVKKGTIVVVKPS